MSNNTQKKSIFNSLWERRFFQFFATYIAASWGAIQALEWAVRRYDLPSIWVDKLVVCLIVLLPLVVSVIYLHGRPGDDKWLKFEKIFYPINIIAALVMSTFLVTSSADERTEAVSFTTDEGAVEVRQVPKSEFISRIAIYAIEEVNDGDISSQGVAIAELLDRKLEQDMRIICTSSMSVFSSYEDYGYEVLKPIPYSTKLRIAEDTYSAYLLDSKFANADRTQVLIKLVDVRSGKTLVDETITGTDIYDLTEKIAQLINDNIKIQEVEGAELYTDLPADNLISANEEALMKYIEGNLVRVKDATAGLQAAKLLEESVEIDPTCVECWTSLSQSQMMSSLDPAPAMKSAMKYVDNVSERQQLNVKYFNYLASNDIPKAERLALMWRKLYPQDIKPVSNLLGIYNQMLRKDEARALAKEAIEDGHGGQLYVSYAKLLIEEKNWNEAEKYLKKYKEEYPKQAEATSLLVDVMSGQGKEDEAMNALEELIIMKPTEPSYKLKKAKLLARKNSFDTALNLLNQELANADLADDSIANYNQQMQVYARALQFDRYYEVRRKMKKTFLRKYPAIAWMQTEYSTVGYYKDIGHVDSIQYNIDQLEAVLPEGQRAMISGVNTFILDLFGENKDKIDDSYETVRPMFEATGSNMVTYIYSSEISYLKGDYEKSIEEYAKLREVVDDVSLVSSNYLEAHYKLGKYEEGLTVINEFIDEDPNNAIYQLYKAKFLRALGKDPEAKKVLKEVMPIFQKSDQRYRLTKEAKELAAMLQL